MPVRTVPSFPAFPVLGLALLACLGLGACQGTSLLGGAPDGARAPAPSGDSEAEEATTAGPGDAALRDVPLPPTTRGDVGAEPGAYAGDERWDALARGWGERVDRALERLAIVTGLVFEPDAVPRVLLGSLGDERRPYELRADVHDGRRRVVLHVNAEPLLGGVLDADRVLLRALCAAAFEEAARRHGPVPRWLVVLAGTAAAGDLGEAIVALARRTAEAGATEARVDPDDATAAEATGLAALLLLAERDEPEAVRRLLGFVADGDDAGEVLGRVAGEADGAWIGTARQMLLAHLGAVDRAPWVLLARAEEAVAESGRAGLEAVLPAPVPVEIAEEVTVLRARAAAAEGDHAQARALLASLPPDAGSRLRDPAAALALRIRVESRGGGDAALARRLAGTLDRDFPRSAARAELRRADPLLGAAEDPQRWMRTMRVRIAAEGTADLDLKTLERYARTLLLDHRAGAAEQFLEGLGARGAAPELAPLRAAVRAEQDEPSPAALARNAERVARWRETSDEEHAQAVRDGGRASASALLVLLAERDATSRAAVLRLLVASAGADAAVRAVAGSWAARDAGIVADLEILAALIEPAPLQARVSDGLLARLGLANAAAVWERVCLGLDLAWLAAHPGFLGAVRDDDYAVRRGAFERILREDPEAASPRLVAHGLGDQAALLRRTALRLASAAGFRALARQGLADRAWLVREEACRVVAALEGRGAVEALIERVRDDEAPAVRGAAAAALLQAAPNDARALRVLVDTQVEEQPGLRDQVAAGLAQAPALPVARAIEFAWQRAVQRPRPNPGFLFRTALLFQRATGVDLGYAPGASREALAAMLRRMQGWIAREAQRAPRARDLETAREAREGSAPGRGR